MKWQKLGRIFEVENIHNKLFSHASNPLALKLDETIYRIFYSSRDKQNRSSVSYFDFDMDNLKVIFQHNEPLFEHGNNNSFYPHGVSIGNVYSINDKNYILFMGWQVEKEHWRGDIGRLELINKKLIKINPDEVFIKCDEEDPISLSYPWVLFDEGIYKMWYGSTITWDAGNNEMLHIIKYATSKNGINWDKHGIAIPYDIGTAQAFSRPTVIKENGIYKMWYSYRGKIYRIGYAESSDGINWSRQDENVGIDVSESGWDGQMLCYPFVFNYKNDKCMLYNGNDYGKTGIGLAVLKS